MANLNFSGSAPQSRDLGGGERQGYTLNWLEALPQTSTVIKLLHSNTWKFIYQVQVNFLKMTLNDSHISLKMTLVADFQVVVNKDI